MHEEEGDPEDHVAEQQQRAFQPADGRRVILSTNVAETSVTLPGIRYDYYWSNCDEY